MSITDERLEELAASVELSCFLDADKCADTADALRELQRLRAVTDKLLAHCPDAECMECAKACCPHGEPLHFHHDGCPACTQ